MIKIIRNIINNIIYANNKVVIEDLLCYSFNYNNNTEYVILYLHRGAFLIRDISYFTLLNKICKQDKKISSLSDSIIPKSTITLLSNPSLKNNNRSEGLKKKESSSSKSL